MAVDDAEVLAGPNELLGGVDALGFVKGAGFFGGGGPGFVDPCVIASWPCGMAFGGGPPPPGPGPPPPPSPW